jgi:hypothetical protein
MVGWGLGGGGGRAAPAWATPGERRQYAQGGGDQHDHSAEGTMAQLAGRAWDDSTLQREVCLGQGFVLGGLEGAFWQKSSCSHFLMLEGDRGPNLSRNEQENYTSSCSPNNCSRNKTSSGSNIF